jgi:hypothetical protein
MSAVKDYSLGWSSVGLRRKWLNWSWFIFAGWLLSLLMLSWTLLLTWLLLWTSLFFYVHLWVSHGLARLPGYSVLFSFWISLGMAGLPMIFIYFQDLSRRRFQTPVWHFFSSPFVASHEISGGSVSPDSPFRHLIGISFIFFWTFGRFYLARFSINFIVVIYILMIFPPSWFFVMP